MIQTALDLILKLLSFGKAAMVPIISAAIIAVPIGLVQLWFFQIETLGEGRAMVFISFLLGLLLFVVISKMSRWIRLRCSLRAGTGSASGESPWVSDSDTHGK